MTNPPTSTFPWPAITKLQDAARSMQGSIDVLRRWKGPGQGDARRHANELEGAQRMVLTWIRHLEGGA